MKTGKLPETVLVRSVLKQVHHRREEVLVGPRVGRTALSWNWGRTKCL